MAVVLTEVVVVEEDSEVVVEADLEGVVEVDLEGVEVAEVDLTEIKTLVHRNMLLVRYIFCLSCFCLYLHSLANCTARLHVSCYNGIHAPRVSAVGEFMHPCEDDIVCKCVTEENKVPYFNAPVYLENKEQIGKVDEIFGQLRDFVSFMLLYVMLAVLSNFTATSKLHSDS